MSTPCFSDTLQNQLLGSLNSYQKRLPSYGGFAKYTTDGQIYDNGIQFTSSSDIASKLGTFTSVSLAQKDGLISFDGTILTGINVPVSSSAGVQKLMDVSNNWMQKSNMGVDGIAITLNDNAVASKFLVDDKNIPSNNTIWTSQKIANAAIDNATVPLLDLPEFDFSTKQDKPQSFVSKSALQCNLQPSQYTMGSSEVTDKLKKANVLLKVNSTLMPQFTANGQLEAKYNFPSTTFTSAYIQPDIPSIDPSLYQPISKLNANQCVIGDSTGGLATTDVMTSVQIQQLVSLGLPKSTQTESLVDVSGKVVDKSQLITADILAVDIAQACSGTFSAVEENLAVFDSVQGNIPVVDSKTLTLNGTYFVQVFVNTVDTGLVQYKYTVRNQGPWNLAIAEKSVLLSKFVIFSL
jgi:hypothetical protein